MTRVTHDSIRGRKIKVTRSLNAMAKNQPYLREWGGLRTSNLLYGRSTIHVGVHSDLKKSKVDVSNVITLHRQFDACLPIIGQRKVAETPKLAGRLSAVILQQFQGLRSPDWLTS